MAVQDSKIIDRKLILLARYQPEFAHDILIPEIEANCKVSDWCPAEVIANFLENKLAPNSLYIHHNYAYADIPTGQEYDMIALMERGKILRDTAMPCKSKVLCFFSAYRTQPLSHASHGHHENSLIQFEDGIPDMINTLYEITKKKPIEIQREICLCSVETFRAICGQ